MNPQTTSGLPFANTTQVPNEVFDYWLPILKPSELLVLLFLVRRTYGWHKYTDQVSIEQIADGIKRRDGSISCAGTGLSESSIKIAIRALIDHGLVERTEVFDEWGSQRPSLFSVKIHGAPAPEDQPEDRIVEGEGPAICTPRGPASEPPGGQPTGPTKENSSKENYPKEDSTVSDEDKKQDRSQIAEPFEGIRPWLKRTFGTNGNILAYRSGEKTRQALEERDSPAFRDKLADIFDSHDKPLLAIENLLGVKKGLGGSQKQTSGRQAPRINRPTDRDDARGKKSWGVEVKEAMDRSIEEMAKEFGQ